MSNYNRRAGTVSISYSFIWRDGCVQLNIKYGVKQSQIIILSIIWQSSLSSYFEFIFIFLSKGWVHRDLRGLQCWHLYKLQVRVSDKFSGKPEEGLFEVVVALRTDVIVLQIVRSQGEQKSG